MKKEISRMVKKTAKIAGVSCLAISAVALVACGAAAKAVVGGVQYVQNRARTILDEETVEAE